MRRHRVLSLAQSVAQRFKATEFINRYGNKLVEVSRFWVGESVCDSVEGVHARGSDVMVSSAGNFVRCEAIFHAGGRVVDWVYFRGDD